MIKKVENACLVVHSNFPLYFFRSFRFIPFSFALGKISLLAIIMRPVNEWDGCYSLSDEMCGTVSQFNVAQIVI